MPLALYASEAGVTNRPEPIAPYAGHRPAAIIAPPARIAEPLAPTEIPSDSGWTLIDSVFLHAMIPAGERLAVKFDTRSESLQDTLLPEFLTALARQAVALAPDWLEDDLADAFQRMDTNTQNDLADLIVYCPDKRYYDEIAFQVAHLSPHTWTNTPEELIVDNVQSAYDIAPDLRYVEIKDYGDPLQGGDYWSTTRYQAIVQGDTTWVEIPRDIYYWWVIMPKITDEQPRYEYGFFWREFLFNECDPGYPLMREVLEPITVLWNGERQRWTNRGLGYPDTLPAVAVVSRWVAHTLPEAAQQPRPIQPILIAKDHNGNCGEVQDLLCAAARTALIPCGGVLDINEDHVWCEIWWDGEFRPWQVDLGGGPTNINNPGIAYDRKYGGSKEVSGVWDWRNDGWQRSVVGTYSDVCTLTVEARDSDARLVDGAIVRLQSEGWRTTEIYNCFFGVTLRNGRYTTTLGDWQNYYLSISSELGGHQAGRIIDSADAAPGTHFFYACTLGGKLDSLVVSPDSCTPQDHYRIDVTFDVLREAVHGYDCWNSGGSNEYTLVCSTGAVDFFILDQQGFEDYVSAQPFEAFMHSEDARSGAQSFVLPEDADHYVVLSNEEQAAGTELVDVMVKLYRQGTGIAEPKRLPDPESWVRIRSNPFRSRLSMELNPARPADFEITIIDRAGRIVEHLWPGPETRAVSWNPGANPTGIYFVRISGNGSSKTVPVVFMEQTQ